MGKAKQRKKARGFGKTSTTPQISTSSNIFYRTLHQISEIEDVEFQQARENSPYLALLWSALVAFHNRPLQELRNLLSERMRAVFHYFLMASSKNGIIRVFSIYY